MKIQNKDYQLKLATKILFDQLGYISFFEVALRNKSYMANYKTHDISDIDVLGFDVLVDLTMVKIGAECKSGESNALEELFKFLGIMKHYSLNRGYLIKTKIHQNAREISANQNIVCYTESELRQLLIGLGVEIDKQFEIENARFLSIREAVSLGKMFNEKLYNYIIWDFWNKDNWRNIHNILHMLKNDIPLELFDNNNIKLMQFFYYVLELLSLTILVNIQKAIKMSLSDIERSLEVSLYGTPEEYHEKRRIHDSVSIATHTKDKFEQNWQNYLITISSRFSQKSRDASKIVHLFKDIVENAFYKDKIIINEKILNKYSDITIKFAQDICILVTEFTSIKEEVFEDFLKI